MAAAARNPNLAEQKGPVEQERLPEIQKQRGCCKMSHFTTVQTEIRDLNLLNKVV